MKTLGALLLIFFAVVAIQVCGVIAVLHYIPNWPAHAQFGDSFSAVNTLFSGLAFGGLIYTVWLQRTELQLQREELQLTRAELSRAAVAQEKSERALVTQAKAAQAAAEIAAINNLLAYVDRETERLSGSDTERIVSRERLTQLATQRRNLVNNLNSIYQDSVVNRLGS